MRSDFVNRSLVLLGVLLCAVAASGANLSIETGVEAEYDNNVFRTKARVDDFIFRLYPIIELYEDRSSDVLYRLRYQVPFSLGVTQDVVNGFDHLADFDSTWHATDRLEVDFENHFGYVRSTALSSDTLSASAAFGLAPQVNAERERFLRNDTTLGFSYQHTPRLSSHASGDFLYFDPERRDRSTSYSGTGIGDLTYVLTPQHSVGVGVQYVYQRFMRSVNVVGSQTDFANGFVQWRWSIDDTTLFSANVGPTWIQSRSEFTTADAINATLGGTPAALANIGTSKFSTVTVFGSAELSKRWTPSIITGLSYERSQGIAGGIGGAVIRDSISYCIVWIIFYRKKV